MVSVREIGIEPAGRALAAKRADALTGTRTLTGICPRWSGRLTGWFTNCIGLLLEIYRNREDFARCSSFGCGMLALSKVEGNSALQVDGRGNRDCAGRGWTVHEWVTNTQMVGANSWMVR